MANILAPEGDVIHAAIEAQNAQERRAAAKSAAAAKAEVCLISICSRTYTPDTPRSLNPEPSKP